MYIVVISSRNTEKCSVILWSTIKWIVRFWNRCAKQRTITQKGNPAVVIETGEYLERECGNGILMQEITKWCRKLPRKGIWQCRNDAGDYLERESGSSGLM